MEEWAAGIGQNPVLLRSLPEACRRGEILIFRPSRRLNKIRHFLRLIVRETMESTYAASRGKHGVYLQ
jgi:hypothetical protein